MIMKNLKMNWLLYKVIIIHFFKLNFKFLIHFFILRWKKVIIRIVRWIERRKSSNKTNIKGKIIWYANDSSKGQ